MLIRLLRTNNSFTLFVLLVVATAIWYFSPDKFSPDIHHLYQFSVFKLFNGGTQFNAHSGFIKFINLLLLVINGVVFTRLLTRFSMIPGRSYLPLLVFLLLSLVYFSKFSGFAFVLPGLLMLQLILVVLFGTADKQKIAFRYFDATLILTITSLFYLPFLFLLPFLFVINFILRNGRWRELVFLVLGAGVVLGLLSAILYLYNHDISDFFSGLFSFLNYKTIIPLELPQKIWIGFIILLYLLSSFTSLSEYAKMKIVNRKYTMLLLLLFINILAIVILLPAYSRDILFLVSLPLSYIISYYFIVCRKNFVNQLLLLLFIFGSVALVFL